jgi:hypothetical protein
MSENIALLANLLGAEIGDGHRKPAAPLNVVGSSGSFAWTGKLAFRSRMHPHFDRTHPNFAEDKLQKFRTP